MISERKKVSLLVMLSCLVFVLVFSASALLVRDHRLNEAQSKALETLAEADGDYFADSIALLDTTEARATEIAKAIGAEVKMSRSGTTASLTLKHGTIESVYKNSAYREYVSEMTPDYKVYLHGYEEEAKLYTNPDYSVNEAGMSSQKYLDFLNLGDTWDATRGAGTTIVVIDSGIDTDHVDFVDENGRSILSPLSYNATTDKTVKDYGLSVVDDSDKTDPENEEMYEEDYTSHGSAVAGVTSAQHNGAGIAGLAPEAELIFIRVHTVDGAFQSTELMNAIEYVIEIYDDESNGFEDFIVNMSFGAAGATSSIYADLFPIGTEKGIIFVASAGNENVMTSAYPSGDPNVIGVGAIANSYNNYGSMKKADYSNYGINTCEVFAPGNVYTCNIYGGWETIEGTSFACPAMVASIALYLSEHPGEKLDDVREALYASCIDLYDKEPDGYDKTFAYGTLDLATLVTGEQIEITYDYNMDGYEITTVTVYKNHLFQCSNRPSNEEYVFYGWCYDEAATQEVDFLTDTFTADITLYAKWESLENIPANKLFSYKTTTSGTVQITSVLYSSEICTIPSEIDGAPVTAIGGQAFQNCDFKQIILPDTLETIGSYAFAYSTKLESVVIPDSVTSIGAFAYYECNNVTTLTLGKNITSIGNDAFAGMYYLTELYYNIENLSNLSDRNEVFVQAGQGDQYEDDSIEVDRSQFGFDLYIGANVLRLPNYVFNPYGNNVNVVPRINNVYFEENSQCTSIGQYAFYAIRMMKSFNCDSPEISIGSYAFSDVNDCVFNFSGVITSIGDYCFQRCENLESVVLGPKVTAINKYAFNGCTSLKEVHFSADIVEMKDYCFSGCSSLETLYAGYSLKKIGTLPFYGCEKLNLYCDFEQGAYNWTEVGNTKYERLIESVAGVYFVGQFNRVAVKYGPYVIEEYFFFDGDSVEIAEISLNNYVVNTDGNTYTFTGEWDVDGDGAADTLPVTLTESAVVSAIFDVVYATKTVTFLNEDGSVYYEYEAEVGSLVEWPEVPEKQAGEGYHYEGEWKGYTEGMTVTEDLTFSPKYTKVQDEESSSSSSVVESSSSSSSSTQEKEGCGVVSFNGGNFFGGGTMIALVAVACVALCKMRRKEQN